MNRCQFEMSVIEAAEYLRVTKQHLHEQIRKGLLKCETVEGRRVITESEINRFSDRREERDMRRKAAELLQRYGMSRDAARKAIYRLAKQHKGAEAFQSAFKATCSKLDT